VEGFDGIGIGHLEAVVACCGEGDDQSTQDGCSIDKGIHTDSVGEITKPELGEIQRSWYDDERCDDDQKEDLPEKDKYDISCRGSVDFADSDLFGPSDCVE